MTMSKKRQRQHERMLAKMKPYQQSLMRNRQEHASDDGRKTGKESARDEKPLA